VPESNLEKLRDELMQINYDLLELLNRRARVVTLVREVKLREGVPLFVPERERKMIDDLLARNTGPFTDEMVKHLFKEIFRASVELMERESGETLRVSRASHPEDLVVCAGGFEIGGERPVVIAGPCAVESEEQMEAVASGLAQLGVKFLRAGTYKPRSSPYAFQGLGDEGLEILSAAARRHGLACVTEVMDTRKVELVARHADVIQVGARNMHNYALLREVGRAKKPVLLKRGLAATIDELLWSSEYVLSEGNGDVILCERGIRTFETQTRNTLDISAVPLVRQMSHLPVVVDVSHAAGRKDILAALARAAIAAGANGVMVEVHPFPAGARSDSRQQLELAEFAEFMKTLDAPPRGISR